MKITNKKTYYKPINFISDDNVIVMWDYKPLTKVTKNNEIVETSLAEWQEQRFNYVPSLKEIKDIIINYYNNKIDNEILSGLTWNKYQIWLSTENQFNYKAAYDIAVQTNGASLPVTFKFGCSEKPIYHTFKTLDDIQNFYFSSIKHIENTLNKGWVEKDSINWNIYDINKYL